MEDVNFPNEETIQENLAKLSFHSKSNVLEHAYQSFNFKGIDGEYNQFLWYDDAKRQSLEFIALLLCLRRMDIFLPMEIREHIFKEVKRYSIFPLYPERNRLQLEWSSWEYEKTE
jgi:hypothetical protein